MTFIITYFNDILIALTSIVTGASAISALTPTAKDDADPNVNPIDREIGGMGIYIVKNIMNQVTYQRLKGKNLLTMKKEI